MFFQHVHLSDLEAKGDLAIDNLIKPVGVYQWISFRPFMETS